MAALAVSDGVHFSGLETNVLLVTWQVGDERETAAFKLIL